MKIALIKGDGIGVDVAEAAIAVLETALKHTGEPAPRYDEIQAGAGYFKETGLDIEDGGEERAIVRHHNYGRLSQPSILLPRAQVAFEPEHSVKIEVVRGLIQE